MVQPAGVSNGASERRTLKISTQGPGLWHGSKLGAKLAGLNGLASVRTCQGTLVYTTPYIVVYILLYPV